MVDNATSIGKVQLDIEINQKSLNIEMNKLGSVFNSNFKNMFGQTNNFVKGSIDRMANNFKKFSQVGQGSNEKVTQSISKMNVEYEKTEATITEIRKELAKLFAEQDEIARGYEVFPAFSGRSKEESFKMMLESDPRFNELSEQIDKLTAKIDPLINKNEKLAAEIERVGNEAEKTGYRIKILGSKSDKTGNNIEKTTKRIRIFGNEMNSSGRKTVGFAHMLDRSFRRVIRRIFVLNLIYKLIRGFMNYLTSALKTNKQFSSSLKTIGTSLRVAFQPIYDFILPALNALMHGIATVTTYIASAISALFGKSYKQSYDAAKGLESAKRAMDGYGKATKKAKGQLAGFDEINQLDIADDEDADEDGSGGFEMEMPDTSIMDFSGFEKFKDMLQPTIDSLKNLGLALEPLKDFAAQGLKDFYNDFLKPVGQWVFGEGLPRFIDAISSGLSKINWQPINDGLKRLWEALTPFAINVGEGLLWFWENVLVLLGTWTMNEVVPVFLDILTEAIRVLNNVIEALKPLGLWLWDSFLEPLAEWTGGIIIGVLSGIKDALQGIGDWINNHQGAVQTMAIIVGSFAAAWGLVNAAVGIWNIIGPIASAVMIAVSTSGGIMAAVMGAIVTPITIVIAIIGSLIAAIVLLWKHWDWIVEKVKWVAEKIVGFFTWLYDVLVGHSIIPDLVNEAVEWFSQLGKWISDTWDSIKAKTEEIWDAIKTFLVETIWKPIKSAAQQIWEAIKVNVLKPVNEAWIRLKDVWTEIKKYILSKWDEIKQGIADMKNKLVSAIISPFDEAKKKIDSVISAAYNWGKNLIQNFINGIKAMISKVKDAVNSVADTVKSFLGFSSPAKEGPGKNADKWMPNLMKMLADGIQDNIYEVSAAVNMTAGGIRRGLQTNDANNIAGAVGSAVMAAMQFNTGTTDGNKEVVIELDGVKLGRVLLPKLNNETQRLGYKPILEI